MSLSSRRMVKLIDGRTGERNSVEAELYRDYPLTQLEVVENQWANARAHAAAAAVDAGLTSMEHEDWDWRNKTDSVEAARHMLVAVECNGDVQGLMAVARDVRVSQLGNGQVTYVDYLESAPWNLKATAAAPRFFGVGKVLIAEAVRLSLEAGLGGRVGLHSLAQAELFYIKCGMTRVGPDSSYFDLTFFEFTAQQATDLLVIIGETS